MEDHMTPVDNTEIISGEEDNVQSDDDAIAAHLDRNQENLEEPPSDEPGSKPNEQNEPAKPPADNEAGRFEERIGALTKEKENFAQQLEALSSFIVNDPAALAAYEKAFGPLQGYQQQYNPPAYQRQQPQQQQVVEPPEWDFMNPQSVNDYILHQINQVAGPYAQQLEALSNQFSQYVSTQERQQIMGATQQMDEFIYREMPSVKDNPVHYHVVMGLLTEKFKGMPQHERYNANKVVDIAKQAVAEARNHLSLSEPVSQNSPKPVVQPGAKRPYSESSGAASKPSKPMTVDQVINEHINHQMSKARGR